MVMEPRKLITLLMERKHLNANSLSEKLKGATTQSQIHRFETGKTQEPKRDTLRPVADFFGIPVDAFYMESMADQVAANLEAGRPLADGLPTSAVYAFTTKEPRPDREATEEARLLQAFDLVLKGVPAEHRSAAIEAAIRALYAHLQPLPTAERVPPGQ
jgi:hypothetical protein